MLYQAREIRNTDETEFKKRHNMYLVVQKQHTSKYHVCEAITT